jgi:hypothetical protein
MGISMRSTVTVTRRRPDDPTKTSARKCNTQNYCQSELRTSIDRQTLVEFSAPNIGGELLSGGQIGFLEFLNDEACQEYCSALFCLNPFNTNERDQKRGEHHSRPIPRHSAVGDLLMEFRKATEFHYYGHKQAKPGNKKKPSNPGKLTSANAATKKLLKKFARLAYRGDPSRRGQVFWERVAWLLWSTYASLMVLRLRAEKIKQQEIARIARLPAKRVARALYMRRYRAKRLASKRRKEAGLMKPGAQQRWQKERQRKRG